MKVKVIPKAGPKENWHYEIDGKVVTFAEYQEAMPVRFRAGHVPSCAGNTTTCWPMLL